MSKVIRTVHLAKDYALPKGLLCVFKDLNFELEEGELVAIMGVSGVGKTTLLNLLGLLDKPTEGKIFLDSEDILSKSEKEKAEIRNRKIGFVFQFYHLLPEFTSLENVSLPLFIRGVEKGRTLKRAEEILEEVSLGEKAPLRPGQLSGGEQQRVAIARALISEPKLLLADEPTGNLDWKTGKMILELICDLHQRKGLSSVIVTHNEKVARFCRKVYSMENGQLKLLSRL